MLKYLLSALEGGGSVGIAHHPVDIGVLEAVRHPVVARETSVAPYLVPGSWRPFDACGMSVALEGPGSSRRRG